MVRLGVLGAFLLVGLVGCCFVELVGWFFVSLFGSWVYDLVCSCFCALLVVGCISLLCLLVGLDVGSVITLLLNFCFDVVLFVAEFGVCMIAFACWIFYCY